MDTDDDTINLLIFHRWLMVLFVAYFMQEHWPRHGHNPMRLGDVWFWAFVAFRAEINSGIDYYTTTGECRQIELC